MKLLQSKLIASVNEFRNEQKSLLAANPELTVGDVTTSNITIINGGVQVNVVPEKFETCKGISRKLRLDSNVSRH